MINIDASTWIPDFLLFSDPYRTAKNAITAYIEKMYQEHGSFELEKDTALIETIKEEFKAWNEEDETFEFYEDDISLLLGTKHLNS